MPAFDKIMGPKAKQTLIPVSVKNYATAAENPDTSLEAVRPLYLFERDDERSAMLYDMYDSSTNRPFIETYNPGVDNRSISDNLSDLDIEGKLDQFSSDEFSSVTSMLESREVCEKQTEPEAKTTAKRSVKGRLKENIDFWREIGTSNWGLKVIEQGYALPFVELPAPAYFGNHPMNEVEKRFLVQEIKNLAASGCVKECKREDLTVINPLKVAKNKEKMRMILDLRYINKHLRSCRFKYEDLRTATDLFEKDG